MIAASRLPAELTESEPPVVALRAATEAALDPEASPELGDVRGAEATALSVAEVQPEAPVVDVILPVHNEAHVLATSVGRLHRYLTHEFPFPWRITIVDNASTDATWVEAQALAARRPEVHAMHLAEQGRGRALKAAWAVSPSPLLAYMDIDLSTGLDALLPLVASVLSGHSDLAVGSRRAPGARVRRSTKREVISVAYNSLLRVTLGLRVRDAQCGFKAISRSLAHELLPEIEDDAWFFDTELITVAERRGLRVLEIPVDWVEDTDSRVRLWSTAWADLRGIVRMLPTRGGRS